ncbi:hypothetical protein LAZ67_12002029, partial [Cordylochernes scorpioides]
MAASDMRNRRHVQPLLTWSTNAAHPVSLDQEPLQAEHKTENEDAKDTLTNDEETKSVSESVDEVEDSEAKIKASEFEDSKEAGKVKYSRTDKAKDEKTADSETKAKKVKEARHGRFILNLEKLNDSREQIQVEALDQPKNCDNVLPLPRGGWWTKLSSKGKVVQIETNLTVIKTRLGWTLLGNSLIIHRNEYVEQTLNLLTVQNDLKELWDLKVLSIRDPIETCSKESRYQELKEKVIKQIQKQSDQIYYVGLPWKMEVSIPNNYELAKNKLEIGTKKMIQQNKLKEYDRVFKDWLNEGLIERVNENPPEVKGYYLTHRPVFKSESKTTPIRPVFDASCQGHNGLSLNQYLEKGPNLLERIPKIMIRFRENKFGVLADIRKAFQMIYMGNDIVFPTAIHIFCDASRVAYEAAAYLRSELDGKYNITLIWSKVRLAPIKRITIPRLELMAMVLGARLASSIQAALKRKCEIEHLINNRPLTYVSEDDNGLNQRVFQNGSEPRFPEHENLKPEMLHG